jgi:hypothetical protein
MSVAIAFIRLPTLSRLLAYRLWRRGELVSILLKSAWTPIAVNVSGPGDRTEERPGSIQRSMAIPFEAVAEKESA